MTPAPETLAREAIDAQVAAAGWTVQHLGAFDIAAAPDGRSPSGRWRAYDYAQLVARDSASLDGFWLKDEALEASTNQPAPEVITAEIVEDLRAALAEFEQLEAALGGATGAAGGIR